MPAAEVLLPWTPSASGFSAIHPDRYSYRWSISTPFISGKSIRERQKLTHPSFTICQAHQKEKGEAMLTDWRADACCNIMLCKQCSQFQQQTLIWSKVVLLAIYFCWSHNKKKSFILFFKLDIYSMPSGKSRPDKWFADKTVSFFFFDLENDFVLMNNTASIHLT